VLFGAVGVTPAVLVLLPSHEPIYFNGRTYRAILIPTLRSPSAEGCSSFRRIGLCRGAIWSGRLHQHLCFHGGNRTPCLSSGARAGT
jgi:hypothetical protein